MAKRWQERATLETAAAPRVSKHDLAHSLKLGGRIFDKRCAGCHGRDGRGDGDLARYLPVRPRNYQEDRFRWGSSPAAIMQTVALGRSGVMPSFAGELSSEEIDSVSRFVWEMIPARRRDSGAGMATGQAGMGKTGMLSPTPAAPAAPAPPTH